MRDRIMKILEHEHLNSAKFADIIGVQRSSVSHILSGRNKPGLDFLNKILTSFPKISGDWLITGEGSMLKSHLSAKPPASLFNNQDKPLVQNTENTIPHNTANTAQAIKSEMADNSLPNIAETLKKIEKIVILYSDKSFSEYTPE